MKLSFLYIISFVGVCLSQYFDNINYVGLAIWFAIFSVIFGISAITYSFKLFCDSME